MLKIAQDCLLFVLLVSVIVVLILHARRRIRQNYISDIEPIVVSVRRIIMMMVSVVRRLVRTLWKFYSVIPQVIVWICQQRQRMVGLVTFYICC